MNSIINSKLRLLRPLISINHNSCRTAVVLRRTRYPKRKMLIKNNLLPTTQEDINHQLLKGQPFERLTVERPFENYYTYEEEELSQPFEPVKVILLRDSDDYGRKGQIVTVDDFERLKLDVFLNNGAVYATEENLKEYKDILIPEENRTFSSDYIKSLLPQLTRTAIPITMNPHNEWTIQPFHIKVGLRRINVECPLDSIEIPPNREIKGPNIDLEQKEFYVYLTANKKERFPMRCVIHHNLAELRTVGWMHRFCEPVFEEDRDFLYAMKRNYLGKHALNEEDFEEHEQRYGEWLTKRPEILEKGGVYD